MTRRLHHVDVVPPGRAAVLAALVRVYARDGRATVRDVMVEAGLKTPSTTHKHLVSLRDAGLIDWSTGHDGTLRPLVRPQPVPQAASAVRRSARSR